MPQAKPHISLGINLSHDASAAICVDGTPSVAIASERLCRLKHGFPPLLRYHLELPWDAICYCLDYLNLGIDDCDRVVLNKGGGDWDWSLLELSRTIPVRDKRKLFCLPSHHAAHAEFAYTASGFDSSIVLIVDRFGSFRAGKGFEAETGYLAHDGCIQTLFQNYTPLPPHPFGHFIPEHSLTALYQFITIAYDFYGVMDECGKTMGLAPFGKQLTRGVPWIRLQDDYSLDCSAFYAFLRQEGLIDTKEMTPMGFSEQGPRRMRRKPYQLLTPDLACHIQYESEKIVLEMLTRMLQASSVNKICLGGGLFHNSALNGKVLDLAGVKNVFVPPAPSDDGNAIGCAYRGCRMDKIPCEPLKSHFLGCDYRAADSEACLKQANLKYQQLPQEELLHEVVSLLAAGKIIGWFHGRSEFGYRALGHRSILADPRDPGTRDYINRFVKHREMFRPLGAIVLEEELAGWFTCRATSPYMMYVGQCLKPEKIPSLAHIDNSTRIQTVAKGELTYHLLAAFFKATGVPVLINTSFNRCGEPIVETPQEAIASFRKMNLDALVIDRFILRKEYPLV